MAEGGSGRWGVLLVAGTVVFVAGLGPPPAGARNAPPPVGVVATFEGAALDLGVGWGQATACLVWQARGVVECFRTSAQMAVRAAELAGGPARRAGGAVSARLLACGTALHLYEHVNYGGRHLQFFDQGFWQNLGDYSFDNQLSSFQVGACSSNLAENASGGGLWYNAGASASVADIGATWNDRVSSIYIN